MNLTDRVSSLKAKQDELRTALRIRDRLCESFVFTPLFCGSESTGYHKTDGFANDIKLGQALAVSGAAVSPNMGYHSSPAITALLTVFNLRLGAWFGNPAIPETRMNDNPTVGWELLMNELMGQTNATDDYVYVSDGGHFENMGIYELIRRRCRFIFAVDADSAPDFHENIGPLVRMARIDFGVRIEIDSTHITPMKTDCALPMWLSAASIMVTFTLRPVNNPPTTRVSTTTTTRASLFGLHWP